MNNQKVIMLSAAVALAYVAYKYVQWNGVVNSLSYNYDKVADTRKQYAPQWSDRYDWMQGVEKRGAVTYV